MITNRKEYKEIRVKQNMVGPRANA